MKNVKLTRWPLALSAAVIFSIAIAACGGGDSSFLGASRLSRDVILSPTQEVEEVSSIAKGKASLRLDAKTGELTGGLSVSGANPTMAHIHAGAAGTNGAVIVELQAVSGQPQQYTVPPNTVLTSDQIEAFKNGGLYINIHSAAFPNGELRGQISREVALARLSGAQELEQNNSQATGLGVVVVNPDTRVADISVTYSGVTPTMGHLHTGAIGTKGDVIVDLEPAGAGKLAATGKVFTESQLSDFRSKKLYFNLHSAAFPEGEIRGQIGYQVRIASMSGSQEVPPVVTAATGIGFVGLDPDASSDNAFGQMTLSGVVPSMAHLHKGTAGTNGAIIRDFIFKGGATVPQTFTSNGFFTLGEADAKLLLTDGLYLNAHTPAFPSGEVRGQLQSNKAP